MKGYKGFKTGLVSNYNNFQYEVGEEYTWEPTGYHKEISLCNRGFHFSSCLKDVFIYYAHNHSHEFCEVEALGKVLTGNDKSCTDKIRIIRKLSAEEVQKIVEKEKNEENDKKVYCLDVLHHLQRQYEFSIGGSVALYLKGYDLARKKGSIDFDVIAPYYQKILPDNVIEGAEEFDAKTSGNDFSITYAITTKDGRFLKLDIRFNNTQRYDITEYKGRKYKTSDLFTILEAKTRYAKEGNKKHQEDILKLLRREGPKKEVKEVDDSELPF